MERHPVLGYTLSFQKYMLHQKTNQQFNPIVLRKAKLVCNFDLSECKWVKLVLLQQKVMPKIKTSLHLFHSGGISIDEISDRNDYHAWYSAMINVVGVGMQSSTDTN